MADFDQYLRAAEGNRAPIHRHCYRMTGSFQDAEDLTQETFLVAWQKLSAFRGESSLDTWLYQIATNLCLSFLRRRKRRELPGPGVRPQYQLGEDLPEPELHTAWLEPYPTPEDQALRREAISLAFLSLLQTVPPRQRAMFILAELLDYSAKEIAALLDASVAAVNSALQRARHALAAHREPEPIPQAAVSSLLERYVSAWESGDVDTLITLLNDDTILIMPPYPVWVRGQADIRRVLLDYPLSEGQRWRLVPAPRANGDFAFGFYKRNADNSWQGWGVHVISCRPTNQAEIAVSRIQFFKGQLLLAPFGLPSAM